MISLSALQLLVYSAVAGAALVPILLCILFLLDYKSNSIW